MRILALDTSTRTTGIALLEGKKLVGEIYYETYKDQSERLIPLVDNILKKAGIHLHDLDALAVSIGPGSFTGLRIGLATAKILSQVVGLSLIGVSSLDALAMSVVDNDNGLICPLILSRSNEVYTALYRSEGGGPYRLTEYLALSPSELVDLLLDKREKITILGNAAFSHAEFFRQQLGSKMKLAPKNLDLPRPGNVAEIARERLKRGQRDSALFLKPVYVRPSAAERKANF